jgi:hypothetical protein
MFKKEKRYHIELDFYVDDKKVGDEKVGWCSKTFTCKNFDYNNLNNICESSVTEAYKEMTNVNKNDIKYRIVGFYKLD